MSVYLFILILENFLKLIQEKKVLKGLYIFDNTFPCTTSGDDTVIFRGK